MNYSKNNIVNDAFVLLAFNLRLFFIVADCGFHQTQRYQSYRPVFHITGLIHIDYLPDKEEIIERGTWEKKLPIWQLIPSTSGTNIRINLGHQENHT